MKAPSMESLALKAVLRLTTSRNRHRRVPPRNNRPRRRRHLVHGIPSRRREQSRIGLATYDLREIQGYRAADGARLDDLHRYAEVGADPLVDRAGDRMFISQNTGGKGPDNTRTGGCHAVHRLLSERS